jgi:hypothetical protein
MILGLIATGWEVERPGPQFKSAPCALQLAVMSQSGTISNGIVKNRVCIDFVAAVFNYR